MKKFFVVAAAMASLNLHGAKIVVGEPETVPPETVTKAKVLANSLIWGAPSLSVGDWLYNGQGTTSTDHYVNYSGAGPGARNVTWQAGDSPEKELALGADFTFVFVREKAKKYSQNSISATDDGSPSCTAKQQAYCFPL